MELFGNYVTSSNITIFLGLLSVIIGGFVILYWKIKTLWYDQQQKFLDHVQAKLNEQTSHIENCIHKVPGHPEGAGDTTGPGPGQ